MNGGTATLRSPTGGDRLLTSGDESGTAPGDRKFRPDVEGLRAVAIGLVVLYHANLSALSGGYVGVDVFFVISGFVITGLLLRETRATGRTSFVAFYARRCRRILPAATLVIVATVVATYAALGAFFGNQAAIDARWTAVFLANFHFASIGTNYLAAQRPPSPLLNFWSLAVEEQFYLVFPAVFATLAALRLRWSLRARLAAGLVAIIVLSFALSVAQTGSNPTVAYFSPFTRAWELALGALVAVGTEWLLAVPRRVGAAATWVGLAAIAFSAVFFNSGTAYPGSLVAIPVVGAALVIAGGMTAPPGGAEFLLGRSPVRYVGKLSYSLYLWHWPMLVIAAEAAGKSSLGFGQSLPWLLAALGASVATYALIENPIRHARFLTARPAAAITMGVVLIAVALTVSTIAYQVHSSPVSATSSGLLASDARLGSADPAAAVENAVLAARSIVPVPTGLRPRLESVFYNWGGPPTRCFPAEGQASVPACIFGDTQGTHTMVLYGDSHAAMWFQAFDDIAKWAHWKLVILGKGYCPDDALPYGNPSGFGSPGGEFGACDQWHRNATDRIDRLHPDLVVMTQEYRPTPTGHDYTPREWQRGLTVAMERLDVPKDHIVVLGNLPEVGESGPACLARHPSDVRRCWFSPVSPLSRYNAAEQAASAAAGARYVSTTPWFCSSTCTAIVGNYEVYYDAFHVTAAYSTFLEGVLARSLSLTAGK
jgi:peptidoglycan/LPS O-acetylase OafA/YrhL